MILNIILILVVNLYCLTEHNFDHESEKTEIFIIGTVHESTPNFSVDTLLNLINKIKPDVILVETDSTYFDDNYELTEDVKYMSPETSAISEYSIVNEVILRPYDIKGRDAFLDDSSRLRNQNLFFNDIVFLKENGKFNPEARKIYAGIDQMMNIAEEMSNSSLSYINSDEGNFKINIINFDTYEGITNLIKETPELSDYADYWKKEYDFWIERNDAMVKNILNFSKEFKGKKILVMCGFAHKTILLTELKLKSEEYNIEVKSLSDL